MDITNEGGGLRDWGEGSPRSLVSGEGQLWGGTKF